MIKTDLDRMKNQSGRKLYSLAEAYCILYRSLRTLPHFKKGMKDGMLSYDFKERLMLAVTEVNGCALCSYGHTQKALESGMSASEIKAMLSGEYADAPQEELPAILFAGHYADSGGKPTKDAWKRILQLYGTTKSNVILGAISLIMAGNTYGIPLGSLKGRFRQSKKYHIDRRSSLPYEVAMLFSVVFFLPLAFLQAMIASLMHLPLIHFKTLDKR